MFSDKLQLSLINNTAIKNLIGDSEYAEGQAGFIKNGQYAWIVRDSTLEVLTAESGVKFAHYNFEKHHGARGCIISCVEEIDYLDGVCLLAVATEFTASGASTGVLSIFCVQGSKIIGSMDFCEKITCCRYIPKAACQRSVLQNFHGTVAIGTDQGKLFLIDLMLPSNGHEISCLASLESDLFPCFNVSKQNIDQAQIASAHRKVASQQSPEKTFFSIQLEVLNDAGAILSILCMPNLYTMAAGLNDGRLILFDLAALQPFHLAYPPNKRAPLTHMSFLEPTDDPRCAVYIWAFHTSNDGAIAVMHSLMFATRVNGIYEDFKSCSVRLTMPMLAKDTFPISCRSIMRTLSQDEEDILTLNAFAWTSPSTKKTTLMIFDLNQWYKEEMPSLGDWRLQLKYTAVFELQNCTSLDVIINENSVFPFNSILRPEEHFYPNSLSFDVSVLENDKFSHYRWFGLQNIALQQFNVIGPQIILEPSYYFNELLQVAILPQFTDTTFSVSTPIDQKREFLLSVALEYNFNGFLKKCAWAWADGSYLGKDESTGIGLSTLTDWIWNRAQEIKEVCNNLCKPLFDYSEQRIDYGTQKQLSQCCKQLKVLSELLIVVLKDYRHFIPDHIFAQLKLQSEKIKMASDYQEVLQWLLNVGLLPEGHYYSSHRDQHFDDEFVIVPYPYQVINNYYRTQRMKLNDDWSGESSRRQDEESSSFLFIDEFIEKECNSAKLREVWNSCYPPRSIQALLRTLLVPDISISNKHVIFVYLFMDITNVLSDGDYSSIVRNLIKFPAVFKMNPALIKRTQAFWNLDNGHLDTAVEELISPLSHDKHLPLWQRELLIGALLKQNANSLALRALRCPGNQISSDLEMMTLLSNNLLSEALKVQRASGDRRLLEKLFEKILHSPNYEQLLDLTLTEEEGVVLGDYLMKLKDSGLPNHLNIHFVFLLQRSKFLDAAQLVESLGNDSNMNLEPPKQVLNAFYASMESTTRRLTSMVYKEDVQVQESPIPLSVNLIRSRCNAKNDIYKQCVQSITEAAYDNTQDIQKLPFIGSPKLGIFEYKQPTVSYHDLSYSEVNEHGKRKQAKQEADQVIRIEELEAPQQKKRKLNESVEVKKRKSYMDMRIANLTVFKETKPNFTFAKRNSGGNSPRATPERVKMFGNFLSTPIVEKATPVSKDPEKCPTTPHSILKTRSCRGSVSPAPSRFSEFGDDNKSVKSITFAALPDSNDVSLNESSIMEESFADEPMESSAENFYSPEKMQEEKLEPTNSQNLIDGPKVRKPIKSRSTTPVDRSETLLQRISQEAPETVKVQDKNEPLLEKMLPSNANEINLNETVSSDDEHVKPYREKSVLRDDSSFDDSEDNSDSSEAPDKSILNFVRKSVLHDSGSSGDEDTPKAKMTISENSSNSETVNDEQFEEEELPDHNDYDESSNEGFDYDNNVNLDDSDDSESQETPDKGTQKPSDNDVICLDSSSDEEIVQISSPVTLPSFCVLDSVESKIVPTNSDFTGFTSTTSTITSQAISSQVISSQFISSQEEMLSNLYDDISKPDGDEELNEAAIDIDSPPYEELLQPAAVEIIEDQFSIIQPAVDVEKIKEEAEEIVQMETNEASPTESQQEVQFMIEAAKNEDVELPTSSTPMIQAEEIAQVKVTFTEEPEEIQEVAINLVFKPSSVEEVEEAVEEAIKVLEKPDDSEVSEEFSFVSASGGELNIALVTSDVDNDSSSLTAEPLVEKPVTSEVNNDSLSLNVEPPVDKTDVTAIETSNASVNLLDQAQITDDISMETANDSINESEQLQETENPINVGQGLEEIQEASKVESPVAEESPSSSRKRRRSSRSVSIEPSDRLLRAVSMPSNASSPGSSLRSRASTEDREAPKKLRKINNLEPIEENAAPSPGVLTRHRSLLLEREEREKTPQTPRMSTRRSSHVSEEGTSTPRRITRATSRESVLATSGTEQTPEEPAQLKRQSSKRATSKRGTSVSADENDDARSTKSSVRSTKSSVKSTRSTSNKKITPTSSSVKESPEKSSPTQELNVTNRRLTRNQLNVLEKSRQLTEKLKAAGALRATKSDVTSSPRSLMDDDSDNESIKSDSGSVASSRASKTRKRKAILKPDKLSIIPEDSREDTSETSSKRGRKAKK